MNEQIDVIRRGPSPTCCFGSVLGGSFAAAIDPDKNKSGSDQAEELPSPEARK